MENSIIKTKSKMHEIYGPPPKRQQIPSESFCALVKIYSLFPDDQNPLKQYASYANLPEYLKNNRKHKSGSEEEAFSESVGSPMEVVRKFSIHEEASNKPFADNLCKGVGFSGSKPIIDESNSINFPSEKKFKDVEENRSTSIDDEPKSQNPLADVNKEDQRKCCKEQISQVSSVCGGLTSAPQKTKCEGGTVASSIRKGNKSGFAFKGKSKKVMDASLKDVKSRTNKLSLKDNGTSDCLKSDEGVSFVCGSVAKLKVCGNTGNKYATKGGNSQKSCKRIQYSRKELLNIRKMTSLPEDMLKTVREIDAMLYAKDQNSAPGKMIGGRGGSSVSKKEKKKWRKRKKRAEMNETLGVKRLKLESVSKPKATQTCRHYLNGSCQQGEKCKFSHDVISLTKSKPCSHFARQGCMRGDDCPYDHNLSKYPCNNYLASGFCSRGDTCLFSHKTTPKECSDTTRGSSKSIKQLDSSNTEPPLSANVSSSSDFAPPRSLIEGSAQQTSQLSEAQKGLSFFTPKNLSMEDFNKHKDADLTHSTGDPPNIVNLIRTLMNSPPPNGSKVLGFIDFVKASVGNNVHKKPSTTSFHCVTPTLAPPAPPKKFLELEKVGDPTCELLTDNGGGKLETTSSFSGNRYPQKSEKESLYGSENTKRQKFESSIRERCQRSLQAALEFAAKFEYSFRTTSTTPKISRNQPSLASGILGFLTEARKTGERDGPR